MSIASRITSIEDHIKNDYNALERLGADLTNVDKNIENIANVVDSIYDTLPKVSDTGSNLSLTPTLKGGLNILPLGNCEQDGTPTPDTPQPIKVVTGDNNVIVQNKNSAYIEDGFDGYFRDYRNGNKTYASSYNGYIARVKSNTTYIGSYDSNESERTGISNLCYFDKNMNYISGILYTSVQGDIFTTPNNCAFVTVAVIKTQTKFQIELGTTATEYVPHQEQSTTLHLGSNYLAGIGDYRDKIVGTKDNWKVVRNVGKYTITSFANKAGTKDNNLYYNGSISSVVVKPSNNLVVVDTFSNYFIKKSTTDIYTNNLQGIAINNQGVINVGFSLSSDYDSLEKVNIWLNTHELILYYQLATPTEETITDTTLINELNELQDLLSYDGTTNITITSDSNNAQMLVQVSALKGE